MTIKQQLVRRVASRLVHTGVWSPYRGIMGSLRPEARRFGFLFNNDHALFLVSFSYGTTTGQRQLPMCCTVVVRDLLFTAGDNRCHRIEAEGGGKCLMYQEIGHDKHVAGRIEEKRGVKAGVQGGRLPLSPSASEHTASSQRDASIYIFVLLLILYCAVDKLCFRRGYFFPTPL